MGVRTHISIVTLYNDGSFLYQDFEHFAISDLGILGLGDHILLDLDKLIKFKGNVKGDFALLHKSVNGS